MPRDRVVKLLDLDPQFLKRVFRHCERGPTEDRTCIFVHDQPKDHEEWHHVDAIADADGVQFLCPVCFTKNGGPVGTHSVICWRPRVPSDVCPKPGRWELVGTGYADLSLVAGSSSVLLQDAPCKAHFFVTNGQIT